MELVLWPLAVLVIGLIIAGLLPEPGHFLEVDKRKVMAVLTIFVFCCCMSTSIAIYADTWDDGNKLDAYYYIVISPHIVEEYDDYVVVSSNSTAVWQSGDYNLSRYNAELRSNREMDSIPVLWWSVCRCSDDLKYVQVR